MKSLLFLTVIIVGCRGSYRHSDPPLGEMTPWSLAEWFDDCRAPVDVLDSGVEYAVYCQLDGADAFWAITVSFRGRITSFTLLDRDSAAVHRAFTHHAHRLLGDRVAAHLEPSVDSDRRGPVSDVSFRVESGPALGKSPPFVRFTWKAGESSETDGAR